MTHLDNSLQQKIEEYIVETPNKSHQQEVRALLKKSQEGDSEASSALESAFYGELVFGTAGLRAQVGAGTARMNRVTVSKASYGVASSLLAHNEVDVRNRGVIIGFDARHMSRQFAVDSAEIIMAQGIPVYMFENIVATPILAYAQLQLNCAAGIMVTASHNPPKDNGYKVYWSNGAQIVPPVDAEIAAFIDTAPKYPEILKCSLFEGADKSLYKLVNQEIIDNYFSLLQKQRLHSELTLPMQLKAVYTAMHGIGHPFAMRAFRECGVAKVISVAEQAEADRYFSTVDFPNPEEVGALDLAFKYASEYKADVVFANDPDADRLAVAVLDRDGNGFCRLSGNQIGALLAEDILQNDKQQNKVMAASLVSSSLLSRMTKKNNVAYLETLTGFKWIANLGLKHQEDHGSHFVFGFEEALGYSCGLEVCDKDGISALTRAIDLFESLKRQSKTAWQKLDEIALKYGVSADNSWSVLHSGHDAQEQLDEKMRLFRQRSLKEIGGEEVVRTRDLMQGTDTAQADGKSILPVSNVITYWTKSGLRLTIRPSGTEPKLKFYLDASSQIDSLQQIEEVKAFLDEKLAQVRKEIS